MKCLALLVLPGGLDYGLTAAAAAGGADEQDAAPPAGDDDPSEPVETAASQPTCEEAALGGWSWAGSWQEAGRVNEDAECLKTTTVEPLDVTAPLVIGENVVTSWVSSSIVNSYFSITPECID